MLNLLIALAGGGIISFIICKIVMRNKQEEIPSPHVVIIRQRLVQDDEDKAAENDEYYAALEYSLFKHVEALFKEELP